MSYHFSTTLNTSFDEAIEKVTEVLKKYGFGILSVIDVHDKFKEKLDVDFRKYRILGACSPPHAYKAIQQEEKIGTMLPCNVIVQEHEADKIEISAINPIASMQAIENPGLMDIALEIKGKLESVIAEL